MNLQECYEAFGGDYVGVMNRLPKEASIIKFLRKFAESDEFEKLIEAVKANDLETVFATSHNLKGMSANLSITEFSKSASDVCECVRGGEIMGDLASLVEKASQDYAKTIDAIKQLED